LIANASVQKAIKEVSKVFGVVTQDDIASIDEVKEHLTAIIRGRITDAKTFERA
jgi:hypothetical protein